MIATPRVKALVSSMLLSGMLLAGVMSMQAAKADSTVIDGPGFKIEKKRGWFGRKNTVYQDAMGNRVEKKVGFFGRKQTKAKMFGSEVVKNGGNMTVKDASGKALVTRKKSLLGGEKTHVDGNGIVESVKNIFR